jgi:hypothetical protein
VGSCGRPQRARSISVPLPRSVTRAGRARGRWAPAWPRPPRR